MESPYIIVKSRKLLHLVPLDDILYIERKGRKIEVETEGHHYSYYGDMREVMPHLDERFAPVLKRFSINLSRLVAVTNGLALFDCGKEYQFAREAGTRLKRLFDLFLRLKALQRDEETEQKMVAETDGGS